MTCILTPEKKVELLARMALDLYQKSSMSITATIEEAKKILDLAESVVQKEL
jgi:hypothetical protein